MNRAEYVAAGQRLHDLLDATPYDGDTDRLLRLVADDMEQDAGIGHAVTFAAVRQSEDPPNAEFWRRLAGSLRKACGMV